MGNLNIGAVRQVAGIVQHFALMLRFFMEHINAGANHKVFGSFKFRPHGLEHFFMFGQQFHGLAVGISNDKVAVNHHHRGLRLVHCSKKTRSIICFALLTRYVGSILNHFIWITLDVRDWVIGCLDPDFFTAFT